MYGKIFEQIYEGSLRLNWKAMITFQQMIVLCNKDGVLDMTPQALHFRTGIPLEIIKEGIEILEQPDEESRTPDEDGRRLVRLDKHRTWGWKLVNHLFYRNLANYEEKKERERKRSAEKRKIAKHQQNQGVAKSCQKLPELPELPKIQEVAHTDTDTNTDTDKLINQEEEF